jgi:hypothetical protein
MREEIDYAILQGGTSRAVGEAFGLSKPTITGHRRSGHHLRRSPLQRDTRTPHDASTLLTRISECRGDHEALQDLRLAASTLQPVEKRILIAELRMRAGKVAARMAA